MLQALQVSDFILDKSPICRLSATDQSVLPVLVSEIASLQIIAFSPRPPNMQLGAFSGLKSRLASRHLTLGAPFFLRKLGLFAVNSWRRERCLIDRSRETIQSDLSARGLFNRTSSPSTPGPSRDPSQVADMDQT